MPFRRNLENLNPQLATRRRRTATRNGAPRLRNLSAANPWIIAHRGASAVAPENTLAAVRTAWEMDADAVEVDVHLTADGHAVVIHDARTRRTTNADLRVAKSTLAQLQVLDAGSFKDARWAHERIPALCEVLATVPPGKRAVLELKAGPELLGPLERDLAAAVGAGALQPAQVVLIAFDRELAALAKTRLPQVSVLWLGDPRRRGVRLRPSKAVRWMAAQARELGLDGLDLFAHRCLNARLVEEIHASGLHLLVWTVNRPRVCARLLRAGVDGITTDRPDVMLKERGKAER